MYVPYYKYYYECGYSLVPLNTTGRWKLETGPYYTNRMFVERKGFLFNHWVSEEDIEFKPEEETKIFNCRGE